MADPCKSGQRSVKGRWSSYACRSNLSVFYRRTRRRSGLKVLSPESERNSPAPWLVYQSPWPRAWRNPAHRLLWQGAAKGLIQRFLGQTYLAGTVGESACDPGKPPQPVEGLPRPSPSALATPMLYRVRAPLTC